MARGQWRTKGEFWNNLKRNGADLPSARKVSNFLNEIENDTNATVNHMFTQWGQYIIHDIVHTPETNGSNIKCPCGQESGLTSTF